MTIWNSLAVHLKDDSDELSNRQTDGLSSF